MVRRVPLADLREGEQLVAGAAGHYLARVLRLVAGDRFVAFDAATAREADAVVVRAQHGIVTVRLGELRSGRAPQGPEVRWIQGAPRGAKGDAVVREATELGASRVVVVATRRSVTAAGALSLGSRRARWARIAEQASRQCGRLRAPLVEIAASWIEALASAGEQGLRVCLAPDAPEPLGPMLVRALQAGEPLAFACGPEGGLDDEELTRAVDGGWRLASLGTFTLRTETVAAAVLGAVRIVADMAR